MKRIGSVLMTLILLLCAVVATLPAPALAEGEAETPLITLDPSVLVKYDKVWFTTYPNLNAGGMPPSQATPSSPKPVQWVVLSPLGDDVLPVSNEKQILLLSAQLLEENFKFGWYDNYYHGTESWLKSDARDWCFEMYLSLPQADRDAVIRTEGDVETDDKSFTLRDYPRYGTNTTYYYTFNNPEYYFSASPLRDEGFFFLSAKEVYTYIFNDPKSQEDGNFPLLTKGWWLRSPILPETPDSLTTYRHYESNIYAIVHDRGVFDDAYPSEKYGARPAFNLEPNAVLFLSAAKGGKSNVKPDGAVQAIPTGSNTEWKLTLKDSSRSGFAVDAAALTGTPGGTISIPYSGAKTGANECVSILICDGTGAAQYYGSYRISTADGTAEFTLPSDLAAGNYTAQVFNEQWNNNPNSKYSRTSDYASDFKSIPLTVGNSSVGLTRQRFEDVAVASDTFTFKTMWEGGCEKSIDFTLYKIDGSVYHHGFDKKVVSNREWRYNAWFSSPAACYVIEEPIPGYITKYVNVGVYAGITDRCYDGGTIINKKIPKTGDETPLLLWAGMLLVGAAGLTVALTIRKRKKAHK
ncbi:MAG: LPXTG cell wall anchor domain-containing protein [Clostridia bacterium]|nr:LPXTG cell wall anchor domain-containing protein [Clostridia bacterium]